MASIDTYIDAAVPRKKVRAAQFDKAGRLPMDEWVARDGVDECFLNLTSRIISNVENARIHYLAAGRVSGTPKWSAGYLAEAIKDIADASNLSDLALSLLPDHKEADGGE